MRCFFVLASSVLLIVCLSPAYGRKATPQLSPVSRPVLKMVKSTKTNTRGNWRGAKTSLLILHQYSDYMCPYCGIVFKRMNKLVKRYPKTIRMIYHYFPLDHTCNSMIKRPFHIGACRLARAAFCAEEQGKFWELSWVLFGKSKKLKGKALFKEVQKLSLDLSAFKGCLKSPKARHFVSQEVRNGIALKLQGTPTFILKWSDGRLIHRGYFMNNNTSNNKSVMTYKALENLIKKASKIRTKRTKSYKPSSQPASKPAPKKR